MKCFDGNPYKFGDKPTESQMKDALEVLKCERLSRWQSLMTEDEKYEVENAHNLCIYLLRELLSKDN